MPEIFLVRHDSLTHTRGRDLQALGVIAVFGSEQSHAFDRARHRLEPATNQSHFVRKRRIHPREVMSQPKAVFVFIDVVAPLDAIPMRGRDDLQIPRRAHREIKRRQHVPSLDARKPTRRPPRRPRAQKVRFIRRDSHRAFVRFVLDLNHDFLLRSRRRRLPVRRASRSSLNLLPAHRRDHHLPRVFLSVQVTLRLQIRPHVFRQAQRIARRRLRPDRRFTRLRLRRSTLHAWRASNSIHHASVSPLAPPLVAASHRVASHRLHRSNRSSSSSSSSLRLARLAPFIAHDAIFNPSARTRAPANAPSAPAHVSVVLPRSARFVRLTSTSMR